MGWRYFWIWKKLHKKLYDESDERYFLEDAWYPEKYIFSTMIYSFCLKRMEIEKVRKFVSNLHDKTEYVMDMRNLKQSLNQGLVLSKSA